MYVYGCLPVLVGLLCLGLILLPFQCHEMLNITSQTEMPHMTYYMCGGGGIVGNHTCGPQ